MDSTTVIMAMILACVGILMIMAFSSPIKAVLRILLGSILGMAGIYAVNMLFPSVNVGINIATAAVTGILGVPGFAVLIVAGLVL
mgnify:CR=1 FL=1